MFIGYKLTGYKLTQEKITGCRDEYKGICLAIIISYNPDSNILQLTDSLLKDQMISKVVIFDNGSETKSLLETLKKDERIRIIYNDENVGLGKGFNISIKKYLDNEKFIATFDQDSIVDKDIVTKLIHTLMEINKFNNKVVSIGPRIVKNGCDYKMDKQICLRPVLITSGNIYYSFILNDIGFYNEEYFIDCLDYEFSLRIRRKYKLVQDRSKVLYQKIGDSNGKISMHSDVRKYYMVRNHIWLFKTYFSKFPIYIIYESLMFLRYVIFWFKCTNSRNELIRLIKKAIKEA